MNSTVVWIVSVLILISTSSNPLPKPLEIVPSSPTRIESLSSSCTTDLFVLWKRPSMCLSFSYAANKTRNVILKALTLRTYCVS